MPDKQSTLFHGKVWQTICSTWSDFSGTWRSWNSIKWAARHLHFQLIGAKYASAIPAEHKEISTHGERNSLCKDAAKDLVHSLMQQKANCECADTQLWDPSTKFVTCDGFRMLQGSSLPIGTAALSDPRAHSFRMTTFQPHQARSPPQMEIWDRRRLKFRVYANTSAHLSARHAGRAGRKLAQDPFHGEAALGTRKKHTS